MVAMATTHTDYYDLLDIDKSAAYDDIKTAYKRQALIWHPDKNSDRLEEATERFKAISEAYKVLSDPRERAWYDTHKDQILSGNSEDLGINLWPYFSPSAYPNGFIDGDGGFYTVYREVFETLSKEENTQATEKTEIQQRPSFGDSTTAIEDVLEFYSYWANFTTIKKFFWADKYDLRDGEQRRIRRLMEAENKKERGKEKKAYVDLVRELAEHVMHRDPRWTEYQARVKAEKEARMAAEAIQKQEESKRIKELKEQYRREEAERYRREYEELKRKQVEEEGEEAALSEEEEPEESFFCEACKKAFSTDKQLNNHEQSKKHKQKLQQIRAEVALPEENPVPPPRPKPQKQAPAKPREEQKPEERKPEVIKPAESSSEDEEVDLVASRFGLRKATSDDEEDIAQMPKPRKPSKKAVPVEEEKTPNESKKMGKAKLKRQKKTEKAAGPSIACQVCGLKFDTRNKLFTHIKEQGHATIAGT